MGGGSSSYESRRIERQEAFVRENVKQFKDTLNKNRRYGSSYNEPYSNGQVEGKLRQLYHNSDTCRDNRRSYINPQEWDSAKSSLGVRTMYGR